jgi:hypothetical protein
LEPVRTFWMRIGGDVSVDFHLWSKPFAAVHDNRHDPDMHTRIESIHHLSSGS